MPLTRCIQVHTPSPCGGGVSVVVLLEAGDLGRVCGGGHAGGLGCTVDEVFLAGGTRRVCVPATVTPVGGGPPGQSAGVAEVWPLCGGLWFLEPWPVGPLRYLGGSVGSDLGPVQAVWPVHGARPLLHVTGALYISDSERAASDQT